jgi:hypothetical protein
MAGSLKYDVKCSASLRMEFSDELRSIKCSSKTLYPGVLVRLLVYSFISNRGARIAQWFSTGLQVG